jgi:hypothetical protein
MSGTNAESKARFGAQIKANEASIAASYQRKKEKREKREKLLQKLENLRLQRLYNLKKRMVVIFAVVNGEIVILTMVDPSLMVSSINSSHIVYGTPEYYLLSMMASYNQRGTRRDKRDFESYTVSTVDGINFNVVDKDGKVFSFETFMKYESLVGQTFSDIQFDQWLYDPINVESDEKTRMIHEELLKVIQHEKRNIAETPTLLEEWYVPYHYSDFA